MIKKRSIQPVAGVDDATKCPCIGSIFVSGVVADAKTLHCWKKLGVKDSKLITPKKRFKLAQIIKDTALSFSIQEITPYMIDDKSMNLNDWEMLIVLNIIQELKKNSSFTTAYIDNWEVTEQRFNERYKALAAPTLQPYLSSKNLTIDSTTLHSVEFKAEHRADEHHTIVGAASLLSKTSSDEQYDRYKKQYGNFGSGSPADPQTRLFVFNHRHNPPPIIRTSWKTYKTLASLQAIEEDPLYQRLKNKRSLKRASKIKESS